MENSPLFYKYYDLLFSTKEYAKEVDCVLDLVSKYLDAPIEQVLEIGCGTGNHTLELAKRDISVAAVDTDRYMIAKAREKIAASGASDVSLHRCPVEELPVDGFPLALALFNVVNYICDHEGLESFIKSVHDRLVPGGMFIFDSWNGIAAILDPPKSKEFDVSHHGKRIQCLLTTKTDFFRQRTILNYAVTVLDTEGNVLERNDFSFSHTLWTPQQIEFAVRSSGFKVVSCNPAFQPGMTADQRHWKIMFVCRKIS